jgi:cytochrome c biogenesis protein CcmG/thiol:disulfide interchange protein DsbE
MRRFKGILRTLGAACALAGAGISAAAAEDVRLDAARIAHLAELAAIDGRPLDAAQLQGRPVLVSFFASWCPPCNTEFEHMKLLQLDHASDGLAIVAVNLHEEFGTFKDDGKRLERFLARHKPVFSVVKGTAETARLFGDVARIPTVYVFGRDGRLRLNFVHQQDAPPGERNPGLDELRRAVRDALGFGAAWSRLPPQVFGLSSAGQPTE